MDLRHHAVCDAVWAVSLCKEGGYAKLDPVPEQTASVCRCQRPHPQDGHPFSWRPHHTGGHLQPLMDFTGVLLSQKVACIEADI